MVKWILFICKIWYGFDDLNGFMSIAFEQYYIITSSYFHSMQLHKRAKTANPVHKHKHQETILKEIKTAQQMEKIQVGRGHQFSEMLYPSTPAFRIDAKRPKRRYDKKLVNSPFAKQLMEIERLNSRESRSPFCFEKDENRICQLGWNQFSEKIERSTHCDLQKIRKRAHQIRSRASVSTIFTKNGLKDAKQPEGGVELAEEKLKDIWNMVKGSDKMAENQRYFRVTDLSKDINQSYILKNAYTVCLNSKKYKESPQSSFVDQKFKSFVYLHQNETKLSKKRLDELLKNNYFLA